MVLRKSRDVLFALISVGPDAAEFFLVNSAVFCRLQLAPELASRTFPISPKDYVIIPKSVG